MAVAYDLLILNLLTLACSLPVFTAGAAVTALNDVTIHIVRQEDTGNVKPFFRSFAGNFKKGTLLWLLLLLAAALLYLDYIAAQAFVPVLRLGKNKKRNALRHYVLIPDKIPGRLFKTN